MAAVAPDECAICFFKYDDAEHYPYSLGDCGHTFCNKCLKSAQNDRCPSCNTTIQASSFKNYALLDLLKPQEDVTASINLGSCAFCNINKSVHGCDDCIAAYCEPCWSTVHKIGALSIHKQTPVKEFFALRCRDHPSIPVEYHCQNIGCGFICSLCAGKFAHVGHKFVSIDDLYTTQTAVVTRKATQLSSIIDECDQCIKDTNYVLDRNEERTFSSLEALKDVVNTIMECAETILTTHAENIAQESRTQTQFYKERIDSLNAIKKCSTQLLLQCSYDSAKLDKLAFIENYARINNQLELAVERRHVLESAYSYPPLPLRSFNVKPVMDAMHDMERRSVGLETLVGSFNWNIVVTKYFNVGQRRGVLKEIALENGHASVVWQTADIDNCAWQLSIGLIQNGAKRTLACFLSVVPTDLEKTNDDWFRDVDFIIAVKDTRLDVFHKGFSTRHTFNQHSRYFGSSNILASPTMTDPKCVCLRVNIVVHQTHLSASRSK